MLNVNDIISIEVCRLTSLGLNEDSFGSKCQCFGFGRQTDCSPDSVALKQRLQNRGFTVW